MIKQSDNRAFTSHSLAPSMQVRDSNLFLLQHLQANLYLALSVLIGFCFTKNL